MRFCCHEEYRVLTCKTPTETITSLRKLERLKSNSDSPLRTRMKLCEAKTLRSDSFMLLDPTSKTSHCIVFRCKQVCKLCIFKMYLSFIILFFW
ncbi:unnamed protein product [Brassica oleracea]